MHFARVTDVPRLAESMEQQIREFVRIARQHAGAPDRSSAIRADMRTLWFELLKRHGCAMSEAQLDDLLASDLDLNTQGLIAWLERLN